MDDAIFQTAVGELYEEALDRVEQRGCRGLFVGGIIGEDNVDGLVLRQLCLNGVQEANELLMPMAFAGLRSIAQSTRPRGQRLTRV